MGRLKMLERSGIFWGKRGDWLLETNGHEWIVEGVMFDNLYEIVDHD